MYGMVNRAIRMMVTELLGAEKWLEIAAEAESPKSFEPMHSYEDAVTYRLVESVCAHTGQDAETTLEAFGRYWIHNVAAREYSAILDESGNSVDQLCANLDHLHERLRHTFDGYNPPSFRYAVLDDNSRVLDYYSQREGLLPFVVGLIAGLAEHTGEKIEIELVPDDAHPMPAKRLKIRVLSQ